MAELILPSRFSQQPQELARVDRSNSCALGLVSATYPSASTTLFDAAGERFWADPYAGESFRPTGITSKGRWRSSGGGSYRSSLSNLAGGLTARYTQLVLVRPKVAAGTTSIRIAEFGEELGGWYLTRISLGNGTGNKFRGTAVGGPVDSDADYVVGQYYAVAFTSDMTGAGVQRLHVNGIKQSGVGAYNGAANKKLDWGNLSDNGVANAFELYGVFMWNRVLSDAEITSVSDNPWQMFKAPKSSLWLGAAATPSGAELAGAAAAAASGLGTLTTKIALTGSAVASATASGTLSAGISLTGSAQVAASASGVLTTKIALSGAAAATASGSGVLTTGIALSGSAVASATGTGNLATAVRLTGAAVAVASGTGQLATAIALTGAAVARATATGALTAPSRVGSNLEGAYAIRQAVAAQLAASYKISGAVRADLLGVYSILGVVDASIVAPPLRTVTFAAIGRTAKAEAVSRTVKFVAMDRTVKA